MNIFESINKVMADVGHIGKEGKNLHQGYNFRGIDQVYSGIQKHFIAHKIFTASEIISKYHGTVQTKTGIANHAVLTMRYRFYAEDGTNVTFEAEGEAIDTSDKASNKAMSAAHKYALCQMFVIPTDEVKDTEVDHHEIQEPLKTSPLKSTTTETKKSVAKVIPKVTQDDNQEPGSYICTFGKYKDRSVQEIVDSDGQYKVSNYIGWLESDAKLKGKPLSQGAIDLTEAFNAFTGIEEFKQDTNSTVQRGLEDLKNKLGMKNEPPSMEEWDPNEIPF